MIGVVGITLVLVLLGFLGGLATVPFWGDRIVNRQH